MTTRRYPDGGKSRMPNKDTKKRAAVSMKAASNKQVAADAVLAGSLAARTRNPLKPVVVKGAEARVKQAFADKAVEMDTSTDEGREAFRKQVRANFRFYSKHVATIQLKSGKLSKLNWNSAQRRLALTLVNQLVSGKPMMAVIAKARQWGCSTLLTALVSWMMLRQDGYAACLVIHDKKFLSEFREKYRHMLLPGCRVLGIRVVVDNAEQIRLSNGSHIDFYAAGTKQTAEKIRSLTYNFAHCTEIPYWYDVLKTMGTVTSTVDLTQKGNGICIESTPRSRGDAFHTLYLQAKHGKTGYAPMFVPWHELEVYQTPLSDAECEAVQNYLAGALSTSAAAHMERELGLIPDKDNRVGRFGLKPQQYVWWCRTFRDKALLSAGNMATEYPDDDETCFLTAGKTVLSGDELKRIGDTVIAQRQQWKRGLLDESCRFAEIPGGWLEVLEQPVDGAQYILAADIAQGAEDGDFTCLGVGRRIGSTLKLVAGMYSHCDTSEAAARAKSLWQWYNNALVIPEANGPGVAFILEARRIGIGNIWVRRKVNTVTGGLDEKLGIQTTASTKPAMIAALKNKMRKQELVCGWAPAYTDLASFCWSDAGCTTAKAVKGAHDDAAMMLAIMCYAFENSPDMGAAPAKETRSPADFLQAKPDKPDYELSQPREAHTLPVVQPSQPRQSGSILDFL